MLLYKDKTIYLKLFLVLILIFVLFASAWFIFTKNRTETAVNRLADMYRERINLLAEFASEQSKDPLEFDKTFLNFLKANQNFSYLIYIMGNDTIYSRETELTELDLNLIKDYQLVKSGKKKILFIHYHLPVKYESVIRNYYVGIYPNLVIDVLDRAKFEGIIFASLLTIILIVTNLWLIQKRMITNKHSVIQDKISDPEIYFSNSSSKQDIMRKSDQNAKLAELKSINSILVRNIRSKDRLLKLVSHDLKAPLRNIIGLIDSIMRKYSGEVNNDLLDRLNRIKNNIEKELHLISDILGDLKSGAIQNKSTDLKSVLETIISQLNYEIQSKKIEVRFNENLPTIKTNGEILKHVFQNLIDNACKAFTQRPGNKITISHKLEQYDHILIITDNGPGIPTEIQENIFEFDRYKQIQRSNMDSDGLGLPLVHTFINMINGKIRLESKQGKGTTFYIHLPRF